MHAITLILLFFSSFSFASKDLVDAFESEIDPHRARQIMAPWRPQDWERIHAFTYRMLWERSHSENSELKASWVPDIRGILGEIIAEHQAIAIAKKQRAHFISEEFYRRHNVRGSKPDGMIVSVHDDEIVIEYIVEAKMGSTVFDKEQLGGLLESLKKRGFSYHNRYFSPKKIFLRGQSGDSHDKVLLHKIDKKQFFSRVYLVGSHPPQKFPGTFGYVGLTPLEARRICERFVKLVVGFQSKPLTEPAEQDLSELVQHWFDHNDRFPSVSSGNIDEKKLAKRMLGNGQSQMSVFVGQLTPEQRGRLQRNGRIPAIVPFFRFLTSQAVPGQHDQFLEMYIDHYVKTQKDLTSLSAILIRANPNWAEPLQKISYWFDVAKSIEGSCRHSFLP